MNESKHSGILEMECDSVLKYVGDVACRGLLSCDTLWCCIRITTFRTTIIDGITTQKTTGNWYCSQRYSAWSSELFWTWQVLHWWYFPL